MWFKQENEELNGIYSWSWPCLPVMAMGWKNCCKYGCLRRFPKLDHDFVLKPMVTGSAIGNLAYHCFSTGCKQHAQLSWLIAKCAVFRKISGWWFGTCLIFPYIGNNHPNWLIFFKMVKATNQIWCSISPFLLGCLKMGHCSAKSSCTSYFNPLNLKHCHGRGPHNWLSETPMQILKHRKHQSMSGPVITLWQSNTAMGKIRNSLMDILMRK